MKHFALILFWAVAGLGADFSERLWQSTLPTYNAILKLPFLTGLSDGTLPRDRFVYYMQQDAIYLGEFSKTLNALAGKAPKPEWAAFLRKGAKDCIESERKLHETYLKPGQLAKLQPNAVNQAYIRHMASAVRDGSFAEGMAAVLPCYWIYWKVGQHLVKQGSKNAEYQRWIDQYADPAYGREVDEAIAIFNASVTPAQHARALQTFRKSAEYELSFWDHAWLMK